ncbi:unnamed protein product [Ostreobium quekettii]|uniref:60S acidic ribosomal protein P2 n=1 Tax=Ostreobium quekettii TaxID=121088 RepID=A0A8S1J0N1_9CHLO|nr:unnamed protein product [Ostreobium quekettii]|eukprot:evm.model.scf_1444.3 EVM.evm.TU.scf_1444.3   scf_1444:27051-28773(-)
MRYVAAYLLAVLGGNASPDAKAIKKILESVGADVDDECLNRLLKEMEGKDVNEVMAAGVEKLASVPAGGGAVASGGGAAAAAGDGGDKEEAKKEEEEEEEEEDEDMGFSLFD